jgi:hypothetical protein
MKLTAVLFVTFGALSSNSCAFGGPGFEERPSRPTAPRVGSPLYACGQWQAANRPAPNADVLVDVFFPSDEGSSPLEPLQSQRDLIALHRGTILYSFHVRALRVLMPADRIPTLAGRDRAIVYAVPDSTRHDWAVIVSYRADRPFGAAEEVRFTSLGGRIKHRWPSINAIAGDLPDESIPALWKDSIVKAVSTVGLACLT